MPIPPPDRMLRRRFCTFCSEPSSTRVVAKQSRIKQVGPADTVSVFRLAFRAQERPAAQAGPDHTTFEGELRPLAAGLGDHDKAARVRGVRYVRFTKEFAVRRRRSAFLSACDRRARLGAMDVPGGASACQSEQAAHALRGTAAGSTSWNIWRTTACLASSVSALARVSRRLCKRSGARHESAHRKSWVGSLVSKRWRRIHSETSVRHKGQRWSCRATPSQQFTQQ